VVRSEAGRSVEATITYSSFAVHHRHLLGSAVFAENLSRDISISNSVSKVHTALLSQFNRSSGRDSDVSTEAVRIRSFDSDACESEG
jgi:hypothetical protein